MKEKRKKPEITCALCVEEGHGTTAFTGTRAQLKKHAATAHKARSLK